MHYIIIPFGNTVEELTTTVASLLVQRQRLGVIILENNGSTCSGLERIIDLVKHQHTVIISQASNDGVGNARNYGLKLCQKYGAKTVSFLDSGDVLSPLASQKYNENLNTKTIVEYRHCRSTDMRSIIKPFRKHSHLRFLNTVAIGSVQIPIDIALQSSFGSDRQEDWEYFFSMKEYLIAAVRNETVIYSYSQKSIKDHINRKSKLVFNRLDMLKKTNPNLFLAQVALIIHIVLNLIYTFRSSHHKKVSLYSYNGVKELGGVETHNRLLKSSIEHDFNVDIVSAGSVIEFVGRKSSKLAKFMWLIKAETNALLKHKNINISDGNCLLLCADVAFSHGTEAGRYTALQEHWQTKISAFLQRQSLSNAKLIIGVSEKTTREIKQFYGLSGKTRRHFLHPRDVIFGHLFSKHTPKNETVYVGALSKRKALHLYNDVDIFTFTNKPVALENIFVGFKRDIIIKKLKYYNYALHPSVYEGFSFSVQEYVAAGLIVFLNIEQNQEYKKLFPGQIFDLVEYSTKENCISDANLIFVQRNFFDLFLGFRIQIIDDLHSFI